MWKIFDQLKDVFRPSTFKPTGRPEMDRTMRSIGRNLEELRNIPQSMRNPRYQERGTQPSIADYFEDVLGQPPPPPYAAVLARTKLDSPPGWMARESIDSAAKFAAKAPFPRTLKNDDPPEEIEQTYEEFIRTAAWHIASWIRPE